MGSRQNLDLLFKNVQAPIDVSSMHEKLEVKESGSAIFDNGPDQESSQELQIDVGPTATGLVAQLAMMYINRYSHWQVAGRPAMQLRAEVSRRVHTWRSQAGNCRDAPQWQC